MHIFKYISFQILFLTLVAVQLTLTEKLPDFVDYGPRLEPKNPEMARSILGYNIYDGAPVQRGRSIKFGNNWENF